MIYKKACESSTENSHAFIAYINIIITYHLQNSGTFRC